MVCQARLTNTFNQMLCKEEQLKVGHKARAAQTWVGPINAPSVGVCDVGTLGEEPWGGG